MAESPNDSDGTPSQEVGITEPESLSLWSVSPETWCDLSQDGREKLLRADPAGLLEFWISYFEAWSTQDLGDEEEAFSPIVLSAGLGVDGADDLLDVIKGFELSDRVDQVRDEFEGLVDECVDWITEYIPIRPEQFQLSPGNFSIENNPSNLAKLEQANPLQIWSVGWGDVPYIMGGFNPSSDPFRVPNYFITEKPHVLDGEFVCLLGLRVTCLLCEGKGQSEEGVGCLACEEGGQFTADVEEVAFRRARKMLPEQLGNVMT